MNAFKKLLLAGVIATAGLTAAGAASADNFTVFNTGVDDAGVALAGGNGVTDTHWQVLSSTSPGVAGQQAVTFFVGAYAAEDGNSRWLSLSDSGTPGSNTTTYRTTFDLTGLDFATAQITGRFSGDNLATIFLNGVNTGFANGSFGSLAAFSLTSGFQAGINFLDVQLQDFGAPAAFRMDDMIGTADLAGSSGPGAIPEPATWAMMIMGFGGVGALIRGRRRAGLAFA